MTCVIVTEKSSAAEHMATALGGMSGTYDGHNYQIVHLSGHLYEFAAPEHMVAPDLADKYYSWQLTHLPWNLDDLRWTRVPNPKKEELISDIRSALSHAGEVVIATDIDPTGEGDLLFWEVIDELHLHHLTFSRMEFVDETAHSLQQAFIHRRPVQSMDSEGAYRKALYRSKFDLLSMQFTRIATALARSCGQQMVIRQGRLKSAMVTLVGNQLQAVRDYVKKPFFQNRFRDENGVVYTHATEPTFDRAGQVPQVYHMSPVVADTVTHKHTAPPKLIDLAALSSILAGHGVKAETVIPVYQKMYERQIVSYPRTEDTTITPAQFDELSPLVDQIAAVVGVDAALLTHRTPRATHVKPTGAHGANRPGPVVPNSLDDLKTEFDKPNKDDKGGNNGKEAVLIYTTVAKSYLAMLAADYEYDHHTGHVHDYPQFTGSVNVPTSLGWKTVFNPDADEDESTTPAGLGQVAAPFVYEGSNPKPAQPTMKWLMKQLEQRTIGTGATRVSTYADVVSTTLPDPLLEEHGTKLALTKAGDISWRLLPHTHIGDVTLTEQVYANMKAIEAGTTTIDACLRGVVDLVRDDMTTMHTNMLTMRQELHMDTVQRATGTWAVTGHDVSFSRTWGGHTFSDEEVTALLAGETITFDATAKDGRSFVVTGALGEGVYNDRTYIGFQKQSMRMRDDQGNIIPEKERATGVWATTGNQVSFTRTWSGHRFTDEEVASLLAGDVIELHATSKNGRPFDAYGKLGYGTFEGKKFFGFQMDGMGRRDSHGRIIPPSQWCGHEFTLEEIDALMSGKSIELDDCISSKGSVFSCWIEFKASTPGQPPRLVANFDRAVSMPPRG